MVGNLMVVWVVGWWWWLDESFNFGWVDGSGLGWVGFGLVVVVVVAAVGCVGNLLGSINYIIFLCKNIILTSRIEK